uniref:epididymal-specific lipocalin-6-like n=1 Tax=Odobenus rosmarus divergens TaxID=9708 RepID=UPI00063C7457|nr:PREDICTED: epididymal-specific lipocalin-6-like [Odobenus rosmarus divergens]
MGAHTSDGELSPVETAGSPHLLATPAPAWMAGPSPPFWAPGWTSTQRTSVSPDVPCIKQLVAHVQLNMPGSDLEPRAQLLMAQLEHTKTTQAEPEDEKTGETSGKKTAALELLQACRWRGRQLGSCHRGGRRPQSVRGLLCAAALALWVELLGSWYALAVASGEKGFALEKASKNIEGVMVTLTPENNLKLLSSRHRLERRDVNVVEVPRQSSGWVFENPSLGVLDYRGLGTNFRDYAIVFTQLEFKDEAFNTVELYSKPEELASQEALRLFARWSKDLGFLSQQQATR